MEFLLSQLFGNSCIVKIYCMEIFDSNAWKIELYIFKKINLNTDNKNTNFNY